MFEKSIILFDGLLLLKDDSNFEKHFKNIYPTELELEKENNNIAILVPLFLICRFILKMENSILIYLTSKITLPSTLQGCHFTATISLAKCSMRALEQSFLEFLKQPLKLKMFFVLVNSW